MRIGFRLQTQFLDLPMQHKILYPAMLLCFLPPSLLSAARRFFSPLLLPSAAAALFRCSLLCLSFPASFLLLLLKFWSPCVPGVFIVVTPPRLSLLLASCPSFSSRPSSVVSAFCFPVLPSTLSSPSGKFSVMIFGTFSLAIFSPLLQASFAGVC